MYYWAPVELPNRLPWLERSGNRIVHHNNAVHLPCPCQPLWPHRVPYPLHHQSEGPDSAAVRQAQTEISLEKIVPISRLRDPYCQPVVYSPLHQKSVQTLTLFVLEEGRGWVNRKLMPFIPLSSSPNIQCLSCSFRSMMRGWNTLVLKGYTLSSEAVLEFERERGNTEIPTWLCSVPMVACKASCSQDGRPSNNSSPAAQSCFYSTGMDWFRLYHFKLGCRTERET